MTPAAGLTTRSPPRRSELLHRAAAAVRTPAARTAIRAFAGTRALVWLIAIYAAFPLYQRGSVAPRLIVPDPSLGHVGAPFGRLNLLFAPLAKWDALWYLRIAQDGYSDPHTRGFFPLYPLAVRAVGGFSGSPRVLLVASYVVALGAFAAALYLLYRLVNLELGPTAAKHTVWLIALFPGAFVFGAPYPESLFLLLSVGAFYAARTERWAVAAVLGLLASATRTAGVLLIVPLALIYLYGPRARGPTRVRAGTLAPRHPVRWDAAWIALVPLGLVAFLGYLGFEHGESPGISDHQVLHRAFGGGSFFDVVTRGVSGVRDVVAAPHGADFKPVQAVGALGFLAVATAGLVGAFRRLPVAYGAYGAVVLALILSRGAVIALPRYLAVVFPLFIWGALFCEERRITMPVIAVSAALLAIFTFQFASWNFVG